jgi:hypothetical protein
MRCNFKIAFKDILEISNELRGFKEFMISKQKWNDTIVPPYVFHCSVVGSSTTFLELALIRCKVNLELGKKSMKNILFYVKMGLFSRKISVLL